MTPDRYGPLPSLLDVPMAVAAELDAWMPEYLRALERQRGLELGAVPTPSAAIVRHAGIWRRGEKLPVSVVWPSGVVDYEIDPDSGNQTGTLQLGVLVCAGGSNEELTARNLHLYVAAARSILLHRGGLGGLTTGLREIDTDLTTIDPEDRGRTRAGATIAYEAPDVFLGQVGAGPPLDADPREDPRPPWPPVELFETDHTSVEQSAHPSDPD
ncbi:hypothetical protein PAI11_37540 [Patulibacter medicamentivorans]|uniref:Phage protein n=1 Tax=Patulibacter medicamentivorans TaxID=1097667 RepID=H0EA80_9ACTN|nr:hypothetical protein [Patulibacter medicamentivorans]EHN09420.1 hypothetical protein PAI11_37540 [Patulibacter medicamentivorans]